MKQKHTRVLTPVFVVGLSDVDVLVQGLIYVHGMWYVCMDSRRTVSLPCLEVTWR
jgi:hypothetical protein